MGTNRRVLILADGDNTFLAAQSFNRRLDWHKIRDYLADPQEGRELIEMVIYIGFLQLGSDLKNNEKPKKNLFIGQKAMVF
jgi:hypothetical protein